MKIAMKALFAFFTLFLTACVSRLPEMVLPQQVEFQGQRYQPITHTQLDKMQQALYLPETSSQDPNNWQQGILFFLDQRQVQQTLAQRQRFREKIYEKQRETKAHFQQVAGELRSEILYPPTDRFANVQLEVSRGRNLPCGYGQIQFADKRSAFAKNSQNLTAYQPILSQLSAKFAQLPWLIECQ